MLPRNTRKSSHIGDGSERDSFRLKLSLSEPSPRLELICVGSELLVGKVNTHAATIGEKLATIGLSIAREHTVGDDRTLMAETFREVFRRADVVLCCGGLGPTFDDITRDVWSRVLGRPLRLNTPLLDDIKEKFRFRGIAMPPKNRRQAFLLRGAEVVPNPNGTAPGQWLKAGKKILVLLPGPARELMPLMEEDVLPRLRAQFSTRFLRHKSFHLVGVPESKVDQDVRPLVNAHTKIGGCRITHGILASQSIITVKFSAEGSDGDSVEQAVASLSEKIRRRLGDGIFGEDDSTLEGVIGEALRKKNQTLAAAESCTGGLIAKMITDQAGSSDYFVEGVVTYSNRSKVARLGVRPASLKKFGAVSAVVAKEMAAGLKKRAGVDYALSVTGVAGPDGGTIEKPVGLVYIGCAGPRRVRVKEFQFSGDRAWIRHRAALMALEMLRRELLA